LWEGQIIAIDGHSLSGAADLRRDRGVESRKNEVSEMFDTMKGAMIGWVATQIKTKLSELLPGFREQYERTESGKNPSSREPVLG
jgi:hypothetical protein